jgi:hypothetical protein
MSAEEDKKPALKDEKVIGNGSFGVVFQATMAETGENVAVKKVLQDKRFKVAATPAPRQPCTHLLRSRCFRHTHTHIGPLCALHLSVDLGVGPVRGATTAASVWADVCWRACAESRAANHEAVKAQ